MLKRAHLICVLISLLALLSTSCGDDTKTDSSDDSSSSGGDVSSSSGDASSSGDVSSDTTSSSSGTTGIEGITFPAGNYLVESGSILDEFPDCINDCPNSATTDEGTPIDPNELRSFTSMYDGFAGMIDGNCHSILRDGKISNGPDTDIFVFQAAAREVIELTFNPVGSDFQPVIYTLDGTRVMTFSAADSPGEPARTRFAVPISNLPFFVVLDDAVNNDLFDTTNGPFTSCDNFSGGASFGYTLDVKKYGFQPTEINAPGTTISNDSLEEQGEVKYYRFYANWTDSPSVTVTRTASANTEFQPTIIAMNTISGQLAWDTVRHDGPGTNGDIALDGTIESIGGFRACDASDLACQSDTAEFIFAVMDWNGGGGSDYTYDVTVDWNP